jgi:hypothetical protein
VALFTVYFSNYSLHLKLSLFFVSVYWLIALTSTTQKSFSYVRLSILLDASTSDASKHNTNAVHTSVDPLSGIDVPLPHSSEKKSLSLYQG